jgi:MFS family permease
MRRGILGLGFDNTMIALSLLLWGIGSGLYFYVWPIYVANLGAGPYEVGLLLALGGLSSIGGYVVGGLVEARFNWRTVLLAAWVVGTAAALVYGLADVWWALAPGVFLLNVSGFGDPSLSGYIAAASDRRRVGATFTTVFAGLALGMAVSPAVGGWASAGMGIRPLFFASAALYTLSTLSLLPITPRQHHAPAPDEPRLLRGEGVSYLTPLRIGAFRALLAVLLALLTTTYLGTSLLPLFLQEQAGLPTSLVGALGSLASLAGVGISLWLGKRSDRRGVDRALALTSILLAGCFGLALLAPTSERLGRSALGALSALVYVLRGSMTAQSTLARASVLQVLRPPVAGRGFAFQMIAVGIAQTAGPFLAGWLYAADPRLPLIVAALAAVLIAAVLWSRPLGEVFREQPASPADVPVAS